MPEFDKPRVMRILSRALKQRRNDDKSSLRDVAGETGVTESTLCRIENRVGLPDAHNIAKLVDYLNIPPDRVLGDREDDPVIYYPDEPLPAIVEAHLAKDENLTAEDAEKLTEIFRSAYNQFSKFGKK